jgi:hypothetical protein
VSGKELDRLMNHSGAKIIAVFGTSTVLIR